MSNFVYEGNKSNKISFPLGGIGTGCIGLAGNGRFVDVEIANRPNKGSHSGYTHFAVKVEDDERVLDARVINSDREPDYIGNLERPKFQGFGFGPDRADMTGFSHFRKSKFTGEFPIAKLDFYEDKFPGKLSMTAFNPFIPTNEKDSSIPGAFFEFEVTNTQSMDVSWYNIYNKNTMNGGDFYGIYKWC
jgi:non-lysosomal glucosylceramidase